MKPLRFCFLASGALLFLFSTGVFAQQLFDSWINYKTPSRPSSVFAVDIDGDGDLDLITCHDQIDATGKNPIVIFKNNGAGFFQRDTTLYTRGAPVQITAKDLDLDGDIDIVTCNGSSNRVSIFKNRGGTGGFELPLDCPVGSGPRGVVLDFMNDDTVPDILTANVTDGTASILINHGAASFPSETTKVLGINPRSIVAFDWDNDGDKDFAATLRLQKPPNSPPVGINGIVVTENKGNGRFDDSARVFFKIPLGTDTSRTDTVHNPVRAVASDFNGDGFSDLALLCYADTFTARMSLFVYINVPSRGGVYRSTDNGLSWTRAVSGLTNNEPRAMAVSAGGEIFAGTAGGGIYRSSDNGTSWTASNTGLTNTTVLAMVFDTSGRLFAGTLGGGIFRSADGGVTWGTMSAGISNPNVRTLLFRRAVDNLFAGTAGGVFRSTNGGANWSKINSGLTDTLVTSLAIEGDSGIIFAGTSIRGIYRSRDNGQHWVRSTTGLSDTNITALAAKSGGMIFAGAASGGVFRSTNYGLSWAAANSGLSNLQIRALAVHPSGDIYAGTATGGVFRSTDNGVSWTTVNSGLLNTKILSLAVGSGGQIFAGTNGALNGASFAVPVRYAVGANCFSMFAGDLDGDGDNDLAVASEKEGVVSILKNNGNGTFAARVNYFAPAALAWVDGGDFDRDGDIDLALVSRTGASMAILRNKGNGTFETGREYSTGRFNSSACQPQGIAAADLEPDGDVDVLVANLGCNLISIHKNNGSGIFNSTPGTWLPSVNRSIDLFRSGSPVRLAVTDLDGDGDLDIAAANKAIGTTNEASVGVLINTGNATFPPTSTYEYPLVSGSGPQSIVAADLDGDGDIDLATPNLANNTVAVLKNNGDGTYAAAQYHPAGSLPNDIKAADFNRDGYNDLAVTNYGITDVLDSVSVFLNDSSGNFPSRTDYLVGSFPTGLDAADFNNDSYPDIAATVAGGGAVRDTAVVVYINDQTGGFLAGVRYLPAPGPAAVVVAADMNADGYLDIVTADSVVNTVSVFFNKGNGEFFPATEYGSGLKPRGLAPADFDGDGDLDLAVANLKMVSSSVDSGAFTILTNLTNSSLIAKGDLNGDGVVNVVDITQELNCAFFGIGSCQTSRADLNCDVKVTLLDVVFIVRKVFGGIPFPCN